MPRPIQDLVDAIRRRFTEWVDAVEGAVSPAPEAIPVPVGGRPGRRRPRRPRRE